MAYRVALRVTGSREDAEDILHDLFLGLPEFLGRYTEHGRFTQWLRRVVVRMSLMRLRRERHDAHTSVEVLDSRPAPGTVDSSSRVDLERAIIALPPSLRAVFVLRQLEGYTHEEIADLLGISPGASRVRYSRALDHLRHSLEP
jgi:RNA polymerase sigma-70 factor (ECF subfamily)